MLSACSCVLIVLLNVISSPSVSSMRRARARSRLVMPLAKQSVDDDAIKLLIDDDNRVIFNASETDLGSLNCAATGRYALVVHGWRESCLTEWVTELFSKLKEHRGGCLMCLDYSAIDYSERYRVLVNNFDLVHQALTQLLEQLEEAGFDHKKGFIFGFSFGARVAIEGAGRFGYQKIGKIDVCDPARPGFDRRSLALTDPTTSAVNVQCIHTSADKGTWIRNCHQDWLMGRCGTQQEAASDPPYGSHGLCPYFYISAFDHDFLAVPKPSNCASNRLVKKVPNGFRMGYMENRTAHIRGDLFAPTSGRYPFNVNLSKTNRI